METTNGGVAATAPAQGGAPGPVAPPRGQSWRKKAVSWLTLGFAARAAVALAVLGGLGGFCYLAGWRLWAARQFRAGQAALQKRDFETAWNDFNNYLRVCPGSAEGHLLAAQAARRGELYGAAEEHLRLCQGLTGPTDAITFERSLMAAQLGQAQPEMEQYLEARAEGDDPDKVVILEALVKGFSKTYRLAEDRRCLDEWLKVEPENVYALMRLAWVDERLAQFDESLRTYERVLAAHPEHVEARLRLAQAFLYAKNDANAALPHFERALQQKPDEVAARLGQAQCWVLLGRTEEARQSLDRLMAEDPSLDLALVERGKLALAEGNTAEAERFLRQAVKAAPDSHDAYYSLYLCLAQEGKTAEAREVQARMGAIDADLQRMETLVQDLQKKPDDPGLECEIAKVFIRLGQGREGERWLKIALRRDPANRPAHEALAAYYERTGQPELARRHREMAAWAATNREAPAPYPLPELVSPID